MIACDAVIVGGGPAGSTCAWALRRAGWNVAIVDRARFPRDKVCAGWLTPQVFPDLELDPEEYRASGATLQTITGFRTGLLGRSLIETRYPRVVSYAIRRCEFDTFLLRRSGARVFENTPLTTLRADGDAWLVNAAIRTPLVVGAGGHFCPVARHLRGGPDSAPPVVAKEAEFELPPDVAAARTGNPELFFCDDLDGYAWCVRKGNYLNVGIGRRDSEDFTRHVREFVAFLEGRGIRGAARAAWRGHAYLAAGTGSRPLVGEGLLLVGDAAGLAYPESGEGIRPAIESGRLAADTLIAAQGARGLDALQPYARELRRRYPPSPRPGAVARAISTAAGRALLGSRLFTRRVLLDRWFLRAHAQ